MNTYLGTNLVSLDPFVASPLQRRDFLRLASMSAIGLAATGTLGAQSADVPRVPLGLDAHSLRAMRWKAPQLIDYAAEQKLDAVLLNSLNYFESLHTNYLKRLKETAQAHSMRIYIGAGGISENSVTFSDKYGSAETLLAEGIRVAQAVGSPVVNVRIGKVDDRYTEGGMQAHIQESVKVLKTLRTRAQDAGIKYGFENHAGDLRSEELLGLIEQVGTDVCGVMLDPGNALWAMEDPMKQIQMLGPHVVCTSVRDYMIWPSEEGAIFQWTAIGHGLMDVPAFTRHMATLCPGVPLFVESISNSPRPIPFLTTDFWKGYPNLHAADLVDFLKLLRRGRPMEIAKPAPGVDAKTFEKVHQQAEFEQSIAYLRQHCAADINQKRS
ncbi:MAG: sugar phosphate isomerase/epimerase [Phycisphaerae bacterium]|nr:sugar phosphate isomerase/epimerase [Phycisphaerae bacterium]